MLENKTFPGVAKIRNGALAAGMALAVTMAPTGSMAMNALLSFSACTNNGADSVSIGEAQLSVLVSDAGMNQVNFQFRNVGPDDSAISEIYFDNGPLQSIVTITDRDNGGDMGVDFEAGATPSELPGASGCSPAFVTDTQLSADAESPPSQLGVDPGETLDILYSLQGGKDFDDVLADLESGALRVGLHVIAFANGQSEGFVSGPGEMVGVSEPGTVAMFGLGLVGFAYARRRKTARAFTVEGRHQKR